MSAILTSASAHDSQVGILLAKMRMSWTLLMMRRQLGHIPLIHLNPRRNQALKEEITAEHKRCRWVGHKIAAAIRYNERSFVGMSTV